MNAVVWRVPGRIEVLGKHTDYAGGNVLVCAIDRGVTAEVRPSEKPGISARSSATPDAVQLIPGGDHGLPDGHWGRYVSSVVDRLASNFGPLAPASVEFTTDLPLANGMSSSSALVVAGAMALADFNGFTQTETWRTAITSQLDLARYLSATENGGEFHGLAGLPGVGTKGGSEDHTAMLCSEAGKLGQFTFSPMELVRRVDFPSDHSFVVAVSGVTAEKSGAARGAYNRAATLVEDLLVTWQRETGRSDDMLYAAVCSSPDAPDRLREIAATLGPDHQRRLEHFLTESNVFIPKAVDALAAGDLAGFGAVVNDSQALVEQLLDNQIPETISLAQLAREMGAVGASAFGAGFGGSVYAIVPTADAESFGAEWLGRYRASYPNREPSWLVTRPGDSAHRVE